MGLPHAPAQHQNQPCGLLRIRGIEHALVDALLEDLGQQRHGDRGRVCFDLSKHGRVLVPVQNDDHFSQQTEVGQPPVSRCAQESIEANDGVPRRVGHRSSNIGHCVGHHEGRHGIEDFFLRREVMVEGALREARLFDDAVHGRAVVTVSREQLAGGADEQRPGSVEVSDSSHNIPTVGL